jgi:hypothetical protein
MHNGNKIALNASHREIQAKKILPPHIVFLNPGKLEIQEIWLPLASITPSTHPRSSSHLQPQRYQDQRLSRGQGISRNALRFCFVALLSRRSGPGGAFQTRHKGFPARIQPLVRVTGLVE